MSIYVNTAGYTHKCPSHVISLQFMPVLLTMQSLQLTAMYIIGESLTIKSLQVYYSINSLYNTITF